MIILFCFFSCIRFLSGTVYEKCFCFDHINLHIANISQVLMWRNLMYLMKEIWILMIFLAYLFNFKFFSPPRTFILKGENLSKRKKCYQEKTSLPSSPSKTQQPKPTTLHLISTLPVTNLCMLQIIFHLSFSNIAR